MDCSELRLCNEGDFGLLIQPHYQPYTCQVPQGPTGLLIVDKIQYCYILFILHPK
jgi:hypothetical protein